jgi:hypothetical protein
MYSLLSVFVAVIHQCNDPKINFLGRLPLIWKLLVKIKSLHNIGLFLFNLKALNVAEI